MTLFNKEIEYPNPIIEEIPPKYFEESIKKMKIIINNSTNYDYMFKIEKITHFIEYATIYVLDELKKYNLIDETR